MVCCKCDRVLRPVYFSDTINSERYFGHILAPFLETFSDDEKYNSFARKQIQMSIESITQELHYVNFVGRIIGIALLPGPLACLFRVKFERQHT